MLPKAVKNTQAFRVFKKTGAYKRLKWLKKYFKKNVVHLNFGLNSNTKRYWNHKLKHADEFWRDENYHHLVDFLPKDEAFSLLDVGCALGDGCEFLKKHFPMADIQGLDISQIGIERARQKAQRLGSGITYFVHDVLSQKLPQKWDYITIVETLEHFDDPFQVVDRCIGFAEKSLIISVPYEPDIPEGPIRELGEHRYSFRENTFDRYQHLKPPIITDYVGVTKAACIIYELKPRT